MEGAVVRLWSAHWPSPGAAAQGVIPKGDGAAPSWILPPEWRPPRSSCTQSASPASKVQEMLWSPRWWSQPPREDAQTPSRGRGQAPEALLPRHPLLRTRRWSESRPGPDAAETDLAPSGVDKATGSGVGRSRGPGGADGGGARASSRPGARGSGRGVGGSRAFTPGFWDTWSIGQGRRRSWGSSVPSSFLGAHPPNWKRGASHSQGCAEGAQMLRGSEQSGADSPSRCSIPSPPWPWPSRLCASVYPGAPACFSWRRAGGQAVATCKS